MQVKINSGGATVYADLPLISWRRPRLAILKTEDGMESTGFKCKRFKGFSHSRHRLAATAGTDHDPARLPVPKRRGLQPARYACAAPVV